MNTKSLHTISIILFFYLNLLRVFSILVKMIFDTKGKKGDDYMLSQLESYLLQLPNEVRCLYKGLIVEIDPTVDYFNSNALIRWVDINEGFNDKLIVNSLEEFLSNFKLVNA